MEKIHEDNRPLQETDAIRQFFRLPISNCSNISLHIDNQTLEIVNIGNRGIAFYADDTLDIVRDQSALHSVTLMLEDEVVTLKGQTMHISASGYRDICGMKFVDIEKESQNILDRYIHNTLNSVFENKSDL